MVVADPAYPIAVCLEGILCDDANLTGSATGPVALAVEGPATASPRSGLPDVLAASALRSARGPTAVSFFGPATSVECDRVFLLGACNTRLLAARATGPASGPVFAASGTGPANAPAPVSVSGSCDDLPCTSVSDAGPARGSYLAVSSTGPASGVLAVSRGGNASATPVCVIGAGCFSVAAVSGEGTASNGAIGTSATGPALGRYLAASGTGPNVRNAVVRVPRPL
jgi:hypothetical protein